MVGYYSAQPLTAERVREAFPVVAFVDGTISVEQWFDYANAMVEANGRGNGQGIITLEDPQRHIVGLSVYCIRFNLQLGRIMDIENFAVVSLIGTQRAAHKLLEAMEELAREQGCGCIAISLLDPKVRRSLRGGRNGAGDFFTSTGFRVDLARLRKCFPPVTVSGPGLAGRVNRPTSAHGQL